MGTYHSICLRILKFDIGYLKRKKDFQIIDDEDQISIVKNIYRLYSFSYSRDSKCITPKKCLSFISKVKSSAAFKTDEQGNNSIDDLSSQKMKVLGITTPVDENIVKVVFKEYQAALLENNYCDFDDLLILTLRLFEEFPEVLNN
jgi:DNA helicase-2/ATP-dependent DNA helicase PcrA